jgi:hypothetical protein
VGSGFGVAESGAMDLGIAIADSVDCSCSLLSVMLGHWRSGRVVGFNWRNHVPDEKIGSGIAPLRSQLRLRARL